MEARVKGTQVNTDEDDDKENESENVGTDGVSKQMFIKMSDGAEPESIEDKYNLGKSRETIEQNKEKEKSKKPADEVKESRENFLKVFDKNKVNDNTEADPSTDLSGGIKIRQDEPEYELDMKMPSEN